MGMKKAVWQEPNGYVYVTLILFELGTHNF